MSPLAITRLVAVFAGAAVLFGLQYGLGMPIYYAIPLATLAYLIVKIAIGMLSGADKPAQ